MYRCSPSEWSGSWYVSANGDDPAREEEPDARQKDTESDEAAPRDSGNHDERGVVADLAPNVLRFFP
jgi:hypothetical protein